MRLARLGFGAAWLALGSIGACGGESDSPGSKGGTTGAGGASAGGKTTTNGGRASGGVSDNGGRASGGGRVITDGGVSIGGGGSSGGAPPEGGAPVGGGGQSSTGSECTCVDRGVMQCQAPVADFCYGEWGSCPSTLDGARKEAAPALHTETWFDSWTYAECDSGISRIDHYWGSENQIEAAFRSATGELLYFSAGGYLDVCMQSGASDYTEVSVGQRPAYGRCEYCNVVEGSGGAGAGDAGGAGGAGGVSSSGGAGGTGGASSGKRWCVLDAQGRVALPR